MEEKLQLPVYYITTHLFLLIHFPNNLQKLHKKSITSEELLSILVVTI